MGWITRIKANEPPHVCPKPSLMGIVKEGLAQGSVWECHTCKKRYLFRGANLGVVDWEEGRAI